MAMIRQPRLPVSSLSFALLLLFAFTSPFVQADQEAYRTAEEELKSNIGTDKTAVREASVRMTKENPQQAVPDLVDLMKQTANPNNPSFYYQMVLGLSSLTDDEGLQLLKREVLKERNPRHIRHSLFFALQLNPDDSVEPVLMEILRQSNMEEERLLAITEVANRGIRDAIDPLIQILSEHQESNTEIELRTRRALQGMTGKQIHAASNWRDWWKDHREDFELPDTDTSGSRIGEIQRGTTDGDVSTELGEDDLNIIVIQSGVNWDSVETMLKSNSIPHQVMTMDEFKNHDLDYRETYALLVNCGATHYFGKRTRGEEIRGDDIVEGRAVKNNRFDETDLREIEQFVSEGGYLFTSDRGLMNLISRTEHLSTYLSQTQLSGPEDETHAIWPVPGATAHNIMKDVFIDVSIYRNETGNRNEKNRDVLDYSWSIHSESPFFLPERPGVNVLVTSPGVSQKYDSPGSVAATFLFGGQRRNPKVVKGGIIDDTPAATGGRVLHVMGHIKDQMGGNQQQFSLQQMLLNFLIEGRLQHIR